ncbi:MAG: transketolase [Candidatus Parcubacteria bacterium]|nr:MAG: transketolase [Candidatus Parcubacteria bacterium]
MLNPELKLNPKIFDNDVEQKPIRDGYGDALVELGEKNQNVIVLTADLAESTRAHKFAEKFPERFIECGVAEQNMAGIAAGLGISGKITFISSYATFSPGKNWETIRTTIIYNDSNVKIAGHHSGIVTGPDGATHQATEDIAIMRCLPNIKVISPCDFWEAKKATLYSAEVYGPFYLRYVRDKTPVITTEETQFRFGKIEEFWIPLNYSRLMNNSRNNINKRSIAIFVTGHLIYQALLAAKELEAEGIDVYVLNVHTIKPLDVEKIFEVAKKVKGIITLEDHQIYGGLGSAISEVLVNFDLRKQFNLEAIPPIKFLGLQNTFGESGKPNELIQKYNLDKTSVKLATKEILNL